MVKDECDILELFIKINARVFDFIYVLDHRSHDGTSEIIEKLQGVGYSVSCTPCLDPFYNQAQITTAAVQQIANSNKFDFIMPLDADEFLFAGASSSARQVIGSLIPKNGHGVIPWKTYCPVSDRYFETTAPLYHNFRMRMSEPRQYYKVVLGNEFAKHCTLSMGNHIARSTTHAAEPVLLPLMLQHVPIRSREQLIRKSLLGSHTLALKMNRMRGEGFHWDSMADNIRDNNYDLSREDLLEMALRYSTEDADPRVDEISEDAPRVGLETDTIEFRRLAMIEPLKSFDVFIADLVARLKQAYRYSPGNSGLA